MLEAGIVANARRAEVATIIDRKSLAVLMYHTRVCELRAKDSETLPSPHFSPTVPRLKGLNGSPLSYSPVILYATYN